MFKAPYPHLYLHKSRVVASQAVSTLSVSERSSELCFKTLPHAERGKDKVVVLVITEQLKVLLGKYRID